MAIHFLAFSFLCKYAYGRTLLLKHPKLFTMGVFSHEGECCAIFFTLTSTNRCSPGPTVEQLKATTVAVTLTARGHTRKAFESGTVKEPDAKTGA